MRLARAITLLLSVLLPSLMLSPAYAASSSSSSALVLQSCSRLQDKEKAACLWENQKIEKELTKKANPPAAKVIAQPSGPVLPSCGRIADAKAKATCLYENRKKELEWLKNGSVSSTSSSSSISVKKVKPKDVCKGLRGPKLAACRKAARAKKAGK